MRGQAHTLEAVAAGTVLLSAIVFATQAAAVTPLTASTSSQHIENQQRAEADGLLAAADANGTLKPTVLFVNETNAQYHNTTYQGAYTNGGPPTAFGAAIDEVFHDEGVAFNLEVHYYTTTGTRNSRTVVNMGLPTDSAVTAVHTLTLYDDDVLYEPDGSGGATATSTTLYDTKNESSKNLYMNDVSEGPVFNVVEVEVTVWRM